MKQEEKRGHEDDRRDDAAEEGGEDRGGEFRPRRAQIDDAHCAEFRAGNVGNVDPTVEFAEIHFKALRTTENETGADRRAHFGDGEEGLRIRDTCCVLAGEQPAGAVDQVDG